MPSNLFELTVFVTFLVPGFVFLIRTETRLAERRRSAIRETATLFVGGLTSNIATFLLYLFVVELPTKFPGSLPDLSLDFDSLLNNRTAYLVNDFKLVVFWSITLFSVACGVASFLAVPPSRADLVSFLRKPQPKKFVPWLVRHVDRYVAGRQGSTITHRSEWEEAFENQSYRTFVNIGLQDGSDIYGAVFSYNVSLEETDERDIRLVGPVHRQTPKGKEWVQDDDVTFVIIPAREIRIIDVYHRPINEVLPETLQ